MASSNPQYVTLTPNTVATLDFTTVAGTSIAAAKVITDGAVANRVYFTADGSTPTTDGAGVWSLLGGFPGYKTVALTAATDATKKVKILSAGAAWVCVEVYPT